MSTAPAVRLIRARGGPREMGRQIGEAAAPTIRRMQENYRELLRSSRERLKLRWAGAVLQARKYHPYAAEGAGQYLEELEGIAEGAGMPLDDLMVLNCIEGIAGDALHLKCTSFAVSAELTAEGHVLVGHNEDWWPEDQDTVYLVHATPENEPAYLAFTYGGLLPNIGFNAAGIAQCCDSVYPNDSRIGIPRVFASRAVLSALTPAVAIRHMLTPHRAAGYNHLLVHESGELYNVEVSARRFAILYGEDGFLVHTNHYLDPQMQAIESEPDELIWTRVRYFRALHLLKSSPLHTVKTLQAIQRDHINFPNSICNHAVDDPLPLDREKTISALVMDLTSRAMHLAWGNPCENQYHTFYLDN